MKWRLNSLAKVFLHKDIGNSGASMSNPDKKYYLYNCILISENLDTYIIFNKKFHRKRQLQLIWEVGQTKPH